MSQVQPLRMPPINLEALQLLSLSFNAFANYDDSAEPDYTLTEIGFLPERHAEDSSRFRLLFEMKFDRPDDSVNTPYEIHARATGYFVARMSLGDSKLSAALVANALTILYGALRGIVMQTTGAAIHGSIVLPTLLMGEIVSNAAKIDPSVSELLDLQSLDQASSGKGRRTSGKKGRSKSK